MAEWLKAHAWKACIRQRIEGSNPFLSATYREDPNWENTVLNLLTYCNSDDSHDNKTSLTGDLHKSICVNKLYMLIF